MKKDIRTLAALLMARLLKRRQHHQRAAREPHNQVHHDRERHEGR